MSDKPNKLVKAITKLIKLTQSGELKWSAGAPYEAAREDIRVGTVFRTNYKNKILRLYKYSYLPIESDLTKSFGISIYDSSKGKYSGWKSTISLEFIDKNGKALWTFPRSNALNDLLEAVQYQVAGLDEFLEEILKD